MPKLAPSKQVVIEKQGYQSISQIRETESSWIFELYNPAEEDDSETEGEG